MVLGWHDTNTPERLDDRVTAAPDAGSISLAAADPVLRTGDGDRQWVLCVTEANPTPLRPVLVVPDLDPQLFVVSERRSHAGHRETSPGNEAGGRRSAPSSH